MSAAERLTPERLQKIRSRAPGLYKRWLEDENCASVEYADWLVDLLAHIDAIEADLATVTAERDQLNLLGDQAYAAMMSLQANRHRLQADLAAVTAERDRLKNLLTSGGWGV